MPDMLPKHISVAVKEIMFEHQVSAEPDGLKSMFAKSKPKAPSMIGDIILVVGGSLLLSALFEAEAQRE